MDKTNSMSNQLESILDDIIQGEELDDKGIVAIDTERLQIKTQEYKVVVNYREGFQLEEFKNRYQEFFEKFDFIVGDWASDMLRLRGFYQIGTRKVPRDQQIDFLDDYLKEYCNFGAAYFVLGKVEALDKYQKMKKRLVSCKHLTKHYK
ncbi:YutD family protein [Aerococcaceae bacterium WGS1372]